MVSPSSATESPSSPPTPPTLWHSLSAEKALVLLESDPEQGLSAAQIQERTDRFGPNELEEKAGRSSWSILLDQFTNIMLIMLLAVAVVSALLGSVKDAIAILVIVGINGLLGYLQESRAEKALAALKKLSSPVVRVQRSGKTDEVPAQLLVPGDIVFLEAGGQVSADGRLLEAANMRIREAALTGEAQAVTKSAAAVLANDASLGDRTNMVFQGTEVLQGRGTMVVTSTGMSTELGRVATLLQGVESEPTPLQRRMSQLGNVLVSGALILVAIVVVVSVLQVPDGFARIFRGDLTPLQEPLQVSLSMAVAVVPEGLPAVITVALALGTQRMVRRNALIRKLPAVETLGSVTTICSDKTGTLTQNKMVVQKVHTASTTFDVSGSGYTPEGQFQKVEAAQANGGQAVEAKTDPELHSLLLACVVCNDAVLKSEPPNIWSVVGDPTEGALLTLAGKAQLDKSHVGQQLHRAAEFPFSSDRKRMSVICDRKSEAALPLPVQTPYLMFTKGSPELVLERCNRILVGQQLVPIQEAQRRQVLQQNEDLAGRGIRVLGFAARELETLPAEDSDETTEQGLVWLGLVGMLDAPRPEVRDAVARCRQAGIRPVMITGDHQLTAVAIATDLGIVQEGAQSLGGKELERLSQSELENTVEEVSVYARVSPEHKLRIVRALQKNGEFVAMTGDGVNDAPAIKQADIGIAMGITGTDVSKEASDMVLLDDNFATIVAATEEGRVVYSNIRRFIKYILGSNIGEVLTIAAAPILLAGGSVPLTPLQILWMNLVTDGLPALALAVEPAGPNVMRRPPFSPKESIFARGLGLYMIRIGIIFGILSIILMQIAFNFRNEFGTDPDSWKTMVFTTLCLAQMGHALAIRSNSLLTMEMNPFSNPYVLGAVSVTSLLQLALIYVEPLRSFFGTHVLSLTQLGICIGFSALMFVWIEGEKLFIRLVKGRQEG
ncbi:cation-translocating P-type ATPase [Leptolyngbya sp. FACHB-261]|uniref:cation-translocating P-type ATPase n=1 Tax=Leptolyngbya sp. FACHB-261 TaxID=2692806 RepID=UPI00168A0B22|nr:cation-translocating P-type ATPase [Leptolyngbya sp. FACHB-261]MBD2104784.1 cation-translocating P-type ATPase [Leptolyngbya sp. FACHB-261]